MRLKGAVFVFLIIYLFGLPAQAKYGGGTGEPNDPYLISTPNDLNSIGLDPNDWGSHFLLVNDINLADYPGTEFNIIGYGTLNEYKPFTGVFDGNGHTISNFTYYTPGTDRLGIGLFGYVSDPNAIIKDLRLIDPNINAGTGGSVGALVGRLGDGTITRCRTKGARVSGGGNLVGGLVGSNYHGTVSNSYATGSVSGNWYVGGLVGAARFGTVSNSYAAGSVSGNDYVGGLVGWNDGTVSNSYATASVSGSGEGIGGLVGWDDGLGDYTKSFWDNTVNPDVNGIGNTTDPNVIGESTANMQAESTFTSAGWDFTTPIWTFFCEGWDYPRLWWQSEPPYDGGSGTESDPYLIYTPCQMQAIGADFNDWDKHFKLIADINLGGYTGTSFNIIGPNSTTPFTGVFDGNGHYIANFNYCPGDAPAGIFGYVSGPGAEIRDLSIHEPNVSVYSNVGGSLAAWGSEGTIKRCKVLGGRVSGSGYLGGLVGDSGLYIVQCSSTAEVSGYGHIGGLVGNNVGDISKCFVNSKVENLGDWDGWVGGLAGINYGTITDCYTLGNVSGAGATGGLTGGSFGYLYRSYAVARVSGSLNVGAVAGFGTNAADYKSCFWDSDVNPDVNGIGSGSDPNVIGESTANMQAESTFTSAGWDFVDESDNGVQNIWRLCNEGAEYPQLNWQFLLGDFGCPDGVESNDLAKLIEQWLLEKLSADTTPDGGDGFVDFLDWAVFADGWQSTTDIDDLAVFVDQWLQHGASFADIAPDGGDSVVNLPDFAALAENWLAGI